MKAHKIVVLALPALALTACGGGRRGVVEIESGNTPVSLRWNATLATPSELAGAVQVRGSAWMGPSASKGKTRAEVRISNAVPGGVHPWHVHRGQCGEDEGILGSPDEYKPLRVSDEGRASASVTLELEAPRSGEYYLNVHASPDNMETIVACGNFAPPVP